MTPPTRPTPEDEEYAAYQAALKTMRMLWRDQYVTAGEEQAFESGWEAGKAAQAQRDAEEVARLLAAINGLTDSPAMMSSTLGFVPLNSVGMRRVVDALDAAERRVRALEAELETLERRRDEHVCGD